ncbi:MAG TPA: GNAT family N-acetyltransferase, partial [Actinomycetes bacterium]|nr:GNAT family N-acetyltransferase [Actinomycetes bacterium]
YVRPARLVDAADFAAVQRRSWQASAATMAIPEPPELEHMERLWERSITVPPSDRHQTWVAVDRTPDSETVVGVAAVAPASDPDVDANRCIELLVLTVQPESRGRGHGSRLLSAALDTAGERGESEAVAWVASGDDGTRRFLESAGWIADGAFRTLSDDEENPEAALRQVRLATSLALDADEAPSDDALSEKAPPGD